jgi:protease II
MFKGDARYADPWRDIGHARWYDPYAALEDPTSHEFKAALETENAAFDAQLSTHHEKISIFKDIFSKDLTSALPKTPAAAQEIALWRGRTVYIQHSFNHRLNVWIVEGGKTMREFEELESFGTDPDSDYYFILKDVGDGDQSLELAVYKCGVHSPQYKLKTVGPEAAFNGDYLYFLETENQLRSHALFRVDKTNGRGRYKVYEERDKRFNMHLFAPQRQPDIFIRIENALSQRIGRVVKGSIKWNTAAIHADANGSGTTLAPITADVYATNEELIVHGRGYRFPNRSFYTNAALYDSNNVLVATTRHGVCSLYRFDLEKRTYAPVFEGQEPCEIMLHDYSTVPSFSLTSYWSSTATYEIQGGVATFIRKLAEPLELIRHATGTARASDGTSIPYTFVSAVKNPKKLLVTGYGAYGLSSHRSYPIRWLPWLRQGYAVVEAAPRGGREDGDKWYDAARTALRKRATFTDAAAVIAAAQKRFRFKKENTVFHGRSAGGWTAAYIGLVHHDRVAAIYAEVPYLDVLRTTTNPSLPLTQLEYDEFGDPARRPEEYAALQMLSPMDIAAAAPAAAPFFLLRSALYDSQVLPYEPLKFAAKLRGLGWPVVTGVDGDGGHFTKTKNLFTILAEDLALLDATVKQKGALRKTRRGGPYARTRLRSHKARGTRRRRTSSKKH